MKWCMQCALKARSSNFIGSPPVKLAYTPQQKNPQREAEGSHQGCIYFFCFRHGFYSVRINFYSFHTPQKKITLKTYKYGRKKAVNIAFWWDAPAQTPSRQQPLRELMKKWRSPFNFECWQYWGQQEREVRVCGRFSSFSPEELPPLPNLEVVDAPWWLPRFPAGGIFFQKMCEIFTGRVLSGSEELGLRSDRCEELLECQKSFPSTRMSRSKSSKEQALSVERAYPQKF